MPGNPNLGIIRYKGKHYSFVAHLNMRDFCEDPEKFIEGVLKRAYKCADLIHLLCLQQYIPNSDISELFSSQDFVGTIKILLIQSAIMNYVFSKLDSVQIGSSAKVDAQVQTPSYYINTDDPDPNYGIFVKNLNV
jgi:hypothetical protein